MDLKDYNLISIKTDIERLQAKLNEKDTEIAKLKKEVCEGFIQFKTTPLEQFLRNFYWSEVETKFRTPERFKEHLNKLHEESKPIYEENVKAAQHNQDVLEKVLQILMGLGLNKETGSYKRNKWVKKNSEWYTEVLNSCPRSVFPIDSKLAEQLKKADEWAAKLKKAKEQEEWAARQEEQNQKRQRVVAALVLKYGLELGTSPIELRDEILSRDKYLRLAYWLERNRSDWNDGTNFAEIGLSSFKCENEIDTLIAAEISSHIEDWCGDGRVFRDCEWNYGKIGALADPELSKDLGQLIESGALE